MIDPDAHRIETYARNGAHWTVVDRMHDDPVVPRAIGVPLATAEIFYEVDPPRSPFAAADVVDPPPEVLRKRKPAPSHD